MRKILKENRYADNAATALHILKSVFRGEEHCDSQPPTQPQVLRGSASTASSAVKVDDSSDLFDESSSNVPCSTCPCGRAFTPYSEHS